MLSPNHKSGGMQPIHDRGSGSPPGVATLKQCDGASTTLRDRSGRLYPAFLDRPEHRLRTRCDAQLRKDIREVRLHGAWTERELGSDLFIAQPPRRGA